MAYRTTEKGTYRLPASLVDGARKIAYIEDKTLTQVVHEAVANWLPKATAKVVNNMQGHCRKY